MKTLSHIRITPEGARLDGELISRGSISGLYREFVGDYPKFFKMDVLCRLGFVAGELLLREMPQEVKEEGAIILFNRNGSLVTDRAYQETIGQGSYYPSPALFVYTLANIVTGEIAIRHKIYGETSFYVSSHQDQEAMERAVQEAFLTSTPSFVLVGWVDYEQEDDYLADVRIVTI